VSAAATNVDPGEVGKFDALASRWWDPGGEFAPLHAINPVRLAYVTRHLPSNARQILDVGCGGGLLTEGLAAAGLDVTGVDASESAIAVARLHQSMIGCAVTYVATTAEDLAASRGGAFDAVTCMELLEHVPDPASLIDACAALVRPAGQVFFSTLNRTPLAWGLAVVAAEYLLGVLPRGTHDYRRFIRPAELARWARLAGLEVVDISGIRYNPLTRQANLSGSIDINYIACLRKRD
jgi:2-polyprenyl-6-hydroxyphenyl methylase/3-demethylubiquinone-9 3-methyltransferase